ncbi:multiple organellar RNA editing factor 3, mitochondrial-like [Cucurbita maxima]|uniref:Multiple organellar RNA editing factor 3, mitochondrial-like n=1 Tax=Cucurbita maxima TaxID=3661 RepID=A0A6J1KHJ4_CUCMA|nr:multiple organellar RNA editing factor 3, mitochondrial-like [Cucurbita maxima]
MFIRGQYVQSNIRVTRQPQIIPNSFNLPVRFQTSGSGYSPLDDPSPNWSNRPPEETILLHGCDYEHWLIVIEFPNDPKPTEEEMVDSYVETLAAVVGRLRIKADLRKRRRMKYTLSVQLPILALVP